MPGNFHGKLRRALLPLLIIALAAGGFMLLRSTRPTPSPVTIEEKAWQVNAVTVTPGLHAPSLLLYGTVEAPRQADLTAAVAADVVRVPVAEGQSVDRDQLLVVLDDRDIELILRQRQADVAEIQASIASEHKRHRSDLAALERERAMLVLDRRAVSRAEDLNRRNMGSESLLDEARMALERRLLEVNNRQLAVDDHSNRLAQLQARLARTEALRDQVLLDRERTRIKAPFAGRITRVPVASGDRVRIGDTLVQLYATDKLEIRAQVPFKQLPLLRDALAADSPLVATATANGVEILTRLDRLSGETARAAGGVDALFRIEQGSTALVPGRIVALTLTLLPVPQTVSLPADALYGLDRIYRLEQERIEAVTVERIGEQRRPEGNIRILVRSPRLKTGDRIITTQLPNAVSGLKVTVTP